MKRIFKGFNIYSLICVIFWILIISESTYTSFAPKYPYDMVKDMENIYTYWLSGFYLTLYFSYLAILVYSVIKNNFWLLRTSFILQIIFYIYMIVIEFVNINKAFYQYLEGINNTPDNYIKVIFIAIIMTVFTTISLIKYGGEMKWLKIFKNW